MPKPSELDLDILALDPRLSSKKICAFDKFLKKYLERLLLIVLERRLIIRFPPF
jgi:hypothetical protein